MVNFLLTGITRNWPEINFFTAIISNLTAIISNSLSRKPDVISSVFTQ